MTRITSSTPHPRHRKKGIGTLPLSRRLQTTTTMGLRCTLPKWPGRSPKKWVDFSTTTADGRHTARAPSWNATWHSQYLSEWCRLSKQLLSTMAAKSLILEGKVRRAWLILNEIVSHCDVYSCQVCRLSMQPLPSCWNADLCCSTVMPLPFFDIRLPSHGATAPVLPRTRSARSSRLNTCSRNWK